MNFEFLGISGFSDKVVSPSNYCQSCEIVEECYQMMIYALLTFETKIVRLYLIFVIKCILYNCGTVELQPTGKYCRNKSIFCHHILFVSQNEHILVVGHRKLESSFFDWHPSVSCIGIYCVQAEAVLTDLQPLLSSPSDITVKHSSVFLYIRRIKWQHECWTERKKIQKHSSLFMNIILQ